MGESSSPVAVATGSFWVRPKPQQVNVPAEVKLSVPEALPLPPAVVRGRVKGAMRPIDPMLHKDTKPTFGG
jgi:hypothetical protein